MKSIAPYPDKGGAGSKYFACFSGLIARMSMRLGSKFTIKEEWFYEMAQNDRFVSHSNGFICRQFGGK
jgi:hypothetical protein